MTFEQFEKTLYSIGELDDIPGAAACGSADFYVKLWRCHGNDKVCQVHQLYEEVTKFLEYEREIARLKGQNDVLRQINHQLKGDKNDGKRTKS